MKQFFFKSISNHCFVKVDIFLKARRPKHLKNKKKLKTIKHKTKPKHLKKHKKTKQKRLKKHEKNKK